MKRIVALVSVAFILINGCKEKKEVKASSVKKADTLANVSSIKQSQLSLKFTARLIYEDGSLSDFDVLNDKSVALWNTIIGSGDAAKPSSNTKLIISGGVGNLHLKIKNGRRAVLDTVVIEPAEKFDYVIKNTGCDEVHITIAKKGKVIYNDTIPFHC